MTRKEVQTTDDPLPEIRRDDLEFYEQLSTGGYGAVYRALWISRKKIVAVKRLFVLEKEANILSSIRHKNIIQFYGVCTAHPDFCIVTEFAENGSLYHFLSDSRNPDLRFEQILNWAVDIAQGVYYLHHDAAAQPILHRDLKSKNVVICADNVCKLCDFGTSRHLTTVSQMTVAGTVPWMSPEMISQKEKITVATDVWSYAVVLWELVTREVPYKDLNEFRIATMIVDQGVTLTVPKDCPDPLKCLITDCWCPCPSDRPDFGDILRRLNRMRGDRGLYTAATKFLRQKNNWREEINTQLDQLKERERDLNDKEQQLHEREQSLLNRERQQAERFRPIYRRQASQEVDQWDEEAVCDWLGTLSLGLTNQINGLFSFIHNQRINGQRLVMLSELDLTHMGIQHPERLKHELERLRFYGHFPPLARVKEEEVDTPVSKQHKLDIVLTVASYTRHDRFGSYRWKLLIDSDWDDYRSDDIFDDLHRSNSLIQSVTVIVPGQEPCKQSGAPFVLRHWQTAANSNNGIKLRVIVNYSDRVAQPRNTAFDVVVQHFDNTQVLHDKRVTLRVKPPERKKSSETPSPIQSTNTPRGVWKMQRKQQPPPAAPTSASAPKSTLWSQIAATVRQAPERPRKASAPTPEVPMTSVPPDWPRTSRAQSDESGYITADQTDSINAPSPRILAQRSETSLVVTRGRGRYDPTRPLALMMHMPRLNYRRSQSDTRLLDYCIPSALTPELEETVPEEDDFLEMRNGREPQANGVSSRDGTPERSVKFTKGRGSPEIRVTVTQEPKDDNPPAAISRRVHGGYGKWAWKK